MSESLADRLVKAGIEGIHKEDCFDVSGHGDCLLLSRPVVVAVLRVLAACPTSPPYEVLEDLADEIEASNG